MTRCSGFFWNHVFPTTSSLANANSNILSPSVFLFPMAWPPCTSCNPVDWDPMCPFQSPPTMSCSEAGTLDTAQVRKVEKVKNLRKGLYPNHMHIFRPWRKHVQSFKKIGIKLYENLRSQGTHRHNTSIESKVRKWQSFQSGKVTKINARITYKPHAYLLTMEKTCAKFQKDRYKTVWGVALTR